RAEAVVAAPADLRALPGGPTGQRGGRVEVPRGPAGDARGDPRAEADYPKQFPQGIPGRDMSIVKNGATSKLARRVSRRGCLEPSPSSVTLLISVSRAGRSGGGLQRWPSARTARSGGSSGPSSTSARSAS